jgi:hypothetical protein
MLKTLLKDVCTGCIKYTDEEMLAYIYAFPDA